MPSFTDIIVHTPSWVWMVFALILLLGWSQSRQRVVHPLRPLAIALLMVGLSLYGVLSSFDPSPGPLLAWAFGLTAALLLLAKWLAPATMRRVDTDRGFRVEIAGSWLPLLVMLGIFGGRYAIGVARALHWPGLHQPGMAVGLSALLGAASGAFAARAVAVARFAGRSRRADALA